MTTTNIYHKNALSFLKGVHGTPFTAIVTDPPAGINLFGHDWDNPIKYESFANTKRRREAFISFLSPILGLCAQKSTEKATLVIWTLPKTSHWTAQALLDSGWYINGEFYHVFATGMPKSLNIANQLAKITQDEAVLQEWDGYGTGLKPAYEKWLIANKSKSDFRHDWFYCKKISTAERRINSDIINNHPSVKTIKLMQAIISKYTTLNDTILDPFMGSGTTGVACQKMTRNFYGIEQDENSFKIAQARLNTYPNIEEICF